MDINHFYSTNYIKSKFRITIYGLRERISIARVIFRGYYIENNSNASLVFVNSNNQLKQLNTVASKTEVRVISWFVKYQIGESVKMRFSNRKYQIRLVLCGTSLEQIYEGLWQDIIGVLSVKRIVLLNDHLPSCLGLFKTAYSMGKESYYFQHAFVAKNFPRLFVDKAFLWGSWSEHIYSSAQKNVGYVNASVEIEYVGPNSTLEKQVGKSGVAIATNPNTEFLKLWNYLNSNRSIRYLCPHPGEDFWRLWLYRVLFQKKLEIVNTSRAKSLCKTFHVGNSGLLFELVMENYLVKRAKIDSHDDYYSFDEFVVFCREKNISYKQALGVNYAKHTN